MKLIYLRSFAFSVVATVCLSLAACNDDDVTIEKPEILPVEPITPVEHYANKPKAIWIDADANFELLSKKANIDAELAKIKKYGLNLIYLDVKPSNGYALYKSDILPYCNTFAQMTVTRDYDDFLGYFLDKCEELGIDVVGSVSATSYGYHKGDFTQGYVYDNWEKWGDKVQVRSDSNDPNVTIPITEDPLQSFAVLDPVFPEVQDLIVDVCRELVTKYPKLKGISLDYLRYNNNDGGWYGMGDANMKGYAEYWNEPVPNHLEIVTAAGGIGPKYAKWIEYRSSVITGTLEKIRNAVKAVNPDCELHMWASAQWSSRFSVGQNWASNKFKPSGSAFTDTYNKTGFAHLLDVFITGAL